jgi:hypothetical protein
MCWRANSALLICSVRSARHRDSKRAVRANEARAIFDSRLSLAKRASTSAGTMQHPQFMGLAPVAHLQVLGAIVA